MLPKEKMTKVTKEWGGKRGENPRIGAKMSKGSKGSKMTSGRDRHLRDDDS